MPDTPPVADFDVGDARSQSALRVVLRRVLTAAGNRSNLAVTASATSLSVTFASQEPDTKYLVLVEPNWLTTHAVTTKAKTGFTLSFGTAAPANATVDCATLRQET